MRGRARDALRLRRTRESARMLFLSVSLAALSLAASHVRPGGRPPQGHHPQGLLQAGDRVLCVRGQQVTSERRRERERDGGAGGAMRPRLFVSRMRGEGRGGEGARRVPWRARAGDLRGCTHAGRAGRGESRPATPPHGTRLSARRFALAARRRAGAARPPPATPTALRPTLLTPASTLSSHPTYFLSILYQRGVYPPDAFEQRRQYGLAVMVTSDARLAAYLATVLEALEGWLATGTLQKLVLVIAGTPEGDVLERWTFDVQADRAALAGEAPSPESRPPKEEGEVMAEIAAVIRQITASVTFLPMLNRPCAWGRERRRREGWQGCVRAVRAGPPRAHARPALRPRRGTGGRAAHPRTHTLTQCPLSLSCPQAPLTCSSTRTRTRRSRSSGALGRGGGRERREGEGVVGRCARALATLGPRPLTPGHPPPPLPPPPHPALPGRTRTPA